MVSILQLSACLLKIFMMKLLSVLSCFPAIKPWLGRVWPSLMIIARGVHKPRFLCAQLCSYALHCTRMLERQNQSAKTIKTNLVPNHLGTRQCNKISIHKMSIHYSSYVDESSEFVSMTFSSRNQEFTAR